jgi:ABC-type lipoprotein export system ATPase subunit
MLELVNVVKNYGQVNTPDEVKVLRKVNLSVRPGESIAVVGPSGCGKSTLLNIMGALDKPTSGKVILDGTDISGLDDKQLALIRNTRIGFVFQLHHLLPQCTVFENVLIPTLACASGDDRSLAKIRALGLLEQVGLMDAVKRRPGELSGGQRQRVAVVRALINKPALLLADEPTGSLDSESAENIGQLLVEINRTDNVAVVIVTHSRKLAERTERIFELREGLLKDGGGSK